MMMRLLHLFVTVLFIFSLATVDALVSACGSSQSDGNLLQSPLDGHCGGLSLFILGSYRWCDLNLTEMFVSLHFQDFSRVLSQKEFCSGLNLTVPAGVNKLTAALHDRKPLNLDICEGCSCSSIYFVADPLLTGPDLFSRLVPAIGLPVLYRILSQMQTQSSHGADLVLGLHAGIEVSRLILFLKSLRASCMDCFIVLFCREISASLQQILLRTNAWCIPYEFWHANSTLGPAGDHRFALYSNFLALAGSSVRRVFLSDVRDVAFQGSPFDSLDLAPLDVVFFLEDKRRLIQVNGYPFYLFLLLTMLVLQDSWTNRHWLTENCSEYQLHAVYERIKHHPRSCSGTALGGAVGMRRYCMAMTAELQRSMSARFDADGRVVSGGWCADQAVHHRLLYDGLLERLQANVRVSDNESGPVLSAGDAFVLHVDAISGVIYNEQGGVPDVVHQYDRPGREAMMDSFVRMYGEQTEHGSDYACNNTARR